MLSQIPERVREYTQSKGVDVVFDCVGGPLFEVGLKSLGPNGRQVNITTVGITRVSFDLLDFYRRQLTLFGVNTSLFDTVASGDILDGLRSAFEQGKLTPSEIARTCSLDEAVEAFGVAGCLLGFGARRCFGGSFGHGSQFLSPAPRRILSILISFRYPGCA